MIKLEGYDTDDTFTFYSVQLMMDFISNELGEGWYFLQDIVCSSSGLPAFIVRR